MDEPFQDLRARLATLTVMRENLERSLTQLRENMNDHSSFRYLMVPDEQCSEERELRGGSL